MADIDESLFWSYVRGVNPGYWGSQAKGFPTDYVMRDMGLTASFGEELMPTLGGLLLFGLSERVMALLPRSGLLLTRFSGMDAHAAVVEQVHVQGNLFRLFDGALNFVRRYADLWEARPSRAALAAEKTAEKPDDQFLRGRANYPHNVIVEAIINSLIHRDWSARERPARLNIYDDGIELINATQMLALPIISLRYGVASAPNPRLKAIFTNRHYGVPVIKGGIPMIFEEAMAFARRAPEGPIITNGEFRLKIYGLC